MRACRGLFLFACLMGLVLFGGCASFEKIASKDDIAVAKTDLAEEILQIKNENRALSERLETTTRQIEELTGEIQNAKLQSANSTKFIQEKVNQLNGAIEGAVKDREKISEDFSSKIQVMLEEVSKENTRLNEKLDKLGAARARQAQQAAASAAQAASQERSAYVVVRGDTLSGIATRHGVTVSGLMALNPSIQPNNLRPGQKITVPSK